MIQVPKQVIVQAAKMSSRHFEECDAPDWQDCPDCRVAFNRAHYAVHAAAGAIRAEERRKVAEEIAEAIDESICDPAEQCAIRDCPDCVRYMQAQVDVLIARKVGGCLG